MSRDRLEHALRLKNKFVDYIDYNTDVKLNYSTSQSGNNNVVEASLVIIKQLSQIQLDKLKEGSKIAINDNEDMLMGILEHYIKDEEEELCKINRIIKRWNNAKKCYKY